MALPTTEHEWNQRPRPVPLEPDATDIYHASHISLKACPFCGKTPMVHGNLNRQTGIYGYYVACDVVRCGASVFANAHDREEARARAIEKWTKRV